MCLSNFSKVSITNSVFLLLFCIFIIGTPFQPFLGVAVALALALVGVRVGIRGAPEMIAGRIRYDFALCYRVDLHRLIGFHQMHAFVVPKTILAPAVSSKYDG